MRSPSGWADGRIRGLAPVATSTTSASCSLVEPSAAVALMRWRARPGVESINSPRPAIT
ncbi:Uncharacterised protein [Mycobacterium tuberculosis]|uniref:Uncharacterized protein n=1 Tax=Mycobacterium tuberculosis TaxID=1773 RepID=A0A655F9K5_MYCTX|nr:Uncharacterised protein [Mycobacterium tuberculosis]CNV56918.1 Uncharacterised protein [Mycobacterium tuberculosis]CNV75737.1 Uncharacterised protein [Mycobacterium tuberculosis]CNY71551.1 Uncharacterised protein [Mycobacterium tuberculosis]COV45559.1 Uncharacterised protein [Mycobacterium tuberculosis]